LTCCKKNFCNVLINLLCEEPAVFPVFQLMLGNLKSPRNNLYPALLHIRSTREHILLLTDNEKVTHSSLSAIATGEVNIAVVGHVAECRNTRCGL